MNEPCAATFVLSSIGFNELNVFIPGLEHEAKIVSSVKSMLITCVRERHYPLYMVIVVKRTHLVALNADWISASGDAFQF